MLRCPCERLGKPEALRHYLKGFWRRRINEERWLVYEITETAINVIFCRDHYSKL
ncbi:type II toxin-antitoxin system YoeB family toxin [Segetibacter sp.]|uniref:type II toxin-antitoxin system YoeB family toxin n=1 Tax=Segetibacter sp. TaxID=2231182 RepID=UPI0034290966